METPQVVAAAAADVEVRQNKLNTEIFSVFNLF